MDDILRCNLKPDHLVDGNMEGIVDLDVIRCAKDAVRTGIGEMPKPLLCLDLYNERVGWEMSGNAEVGPKTLAQEPQINQDRGGDRRPNDFCPRAAMTVPGFAARLAAVSNT